VLGKIVYLRQHYHFEPHKISVYLKRYHDVQVSQSGVLRIMKRLDVRRLPACQRYKRPVDRCKRYEKPPPGGLRSESEGRSDHLRQAESWEVRVGAGCRREDRCVSDEQTVDVMDAAGWTDH